MKKILETLKQKWAEYLLEIVVIVVSILGAFMLDNWNDTRKENIEEQKILRTLKSDFESNKTQLKNNINETEMLVSNCRKLFELFRKTQAELKQLPSDSILTSPGGYATFNPSDGALTSLIVSGQLNIITNDSLKIKLTNWPNLVNDAKEDEDILVEKITKDLVNQQLKYLSYLDNPKFKLDKLAMFDDYILQNKYHRVYRGARYQIYLYKELDEEIDEILRLIDVNINVN